MRNIIFSARFKKDIKFYQRKHVNLESFELVLYLLKHGIEFPAKFRLHKLKGDMTGYMECHIKDDILLLYIDGDDSVTLLRLASHDELFK